MYGGGEDSPRLVVGFVLCLLFHVHVATSYFVLYLSFGALEQLFPGFRAGEAGYGLQLFLLFPNEIIQFSSKSV